MMAWSSVTFSWVLFILMTLTLAWPFRRRDIFDNAVDSPDGLIAHLQRRGESLYKRPDNETGWKVAQWNESMNVNPEELGSYAEGDILYPSGIRRNGLKSLTYRWPSGVVPYMISSDFNATQRKLIFDAMDDYHKYTCIKFKPYQGRKKDYIRMTAGNTGCWSSVGRIGGRQDINLQVPGCLVRKGTVIHELMHAVGFLHEQSRYERDDYVNILWQNVLNGHSGNFEKASKNTTNTFGVSYDYGSVMHYSSRAFSKNGQPTIVPKEQLIGLLGFIGEIFQINRVELGQRNGFSKKDIQKINRMYNCSRTQG